MNILLLSQFFSTTRGGGEYVFSLIAKNLANNGHKVWIITNKINDENYRSHKNIEMIFVKPNLEYKGGLPAGLFDNMRYSINTIRMGLKIIKNQDITLIHSNNFAPSFAGSILSFLTSKPHVTAVWDIFSLCGKDYWDRWTKQLRISRLYAYLGPQFEKIILKLPHKAIHTISESSLEDLIKFGEKGPIYVIPPTIEINRSVECKVNSHQFVYVGRLVFYKNVEIIIKSIDIVKKLEPEVKLIIIGDGPHKHHLEKIVHDMRLEQNVEFKGYVNVEEKIRIISSSSALLFPSFCEGFGLVILEGFEQSKPVIVSNVKPMSQIVSHGETGFVLDPYDQVIWAEHLLRIIQNPEEGIMMGKNGNETLIKKYGILQMYNKIIEMYNNILK